MILWETYFDSAQEALAAGDYAKALELLLSAQEEIESEQVRDGRWLRTVLSLAQCYLRLERFDEAHAALELDAGAVSACPTGSQIQYWEILAQLQQARGEEEAERESWSRWLALLANQAPDAARLQVLERISSLAENGPADLQQLVWSKRYDWARSLLGPADPQTLAALRRLIDLQVEAGLFQEAQQRIEELVAHLKEEGGDTDILLRTQGELARVLSAQGKQSEAWALYAELLSADLLSTQEAIAAMVWAFDAGLAEQVFELAEAHLACLEDPQPEHLELLTRIVASAAGMDRVHWARARVDWSANFEIEADIRHQWVWELALIQESQSLHEQAFPFWQQILQNRQPADAQGAAHLRHARRPEGVLAERIAHYKMALQDLLEHSPWSEEQLADVSAWSDLELEAERLDDAGQRLQALLDRLEEQQLQNSPLYPSALLRLAQILSRRGELEPAARLVSGAYQLAQATPGMESLALESSRLGLTLAIDLQNAESYQEWAERLRAVGEEPASFERVWLLEDLQALIQSGEWTELERRAADFAARLSDDSPAEHFQVLLWQAEALEQQGRWNDALEGRELLPERLSERLGEAHPITLKASMQLGQAYNAVSRFNEGEKVLAKAARRYEKAYGSDSLEVGRVLLALAESFRLQGKDNLMEAVSGRAVGLLEKHLPAGHPERLQAQRDRAQWLLDQGRTDEARAQLQALQEEEVAAFGEDHPELAVTLSQWAGLETARGDYVAAESYYRRSLEMFRLGLGQAHPNVAATLNNLGQNLYRQARYSEAAEIIEQALQVFDESDHGRISSMVNLGLVYQATRQFPEAREWLRKALDLSTRVLGEDDLEVAFCCYTLAEVLEAMGIPERAYARAEQALKIREQRLGGLHPETAASQNQLGRLLIAAGRTSEAIPMVQGALRIQVQALGPDHPELAPTYASLGRLLLAAQDWAQAEEVLLKAVHLVDGATTEISAELADLVAELGRLRAAQGDLEQAVGFSARATELLASALGPDHPAIDGALIQLGELFAQSASFKEAESCFKRVMEQRSRRFGPEHPQVAEIWLRLARLQAGQGRLAVAETLARKALGLLARSVSETSAENGPTLEFLRELAQLAGREDEVATLQQRLDSLDEPVISVDPDPSSDELSAVEEVVESEEPGADAEPQPPAESKVDEQPVVEEEAATVAEDSAADTVVAAEPEVTPSPSEELSGAADTEVVEPVSEPGPATEVLESVEPEESVDSVESVEPELEVVAETPVEPEPEPELEIEQVNPEELLQRALGQANWVQARELLRARLAEQGGHPEAATLHQLARVERALGELATAESLLVQVVSQWSQPQADVAPALLAFALSDLAEVSFAVGKADQAEGLLRKATEMQVRSLATDSPELTPWWLRLGEIYLSHRPAQALAPLQQAQQLTLAQHQPDPDLQARLLWALAQAFEASGDRTEAVAQLRARVALPDGEQALPAQLRLAQLLLLSDQVESATQILHKLEVFLPVPPPVIEEEVKATLGHVMVQSQRLEEAESRLLEALQLRSQRLGTKDPALVPLLADLARIFAGRDMDQQVALFGQQALDLMEEDNPSLRLEIASLLGPALLRLGRSSESEAVFRQWLELARSQHGEQSPQLLPPLHTLARLLRARSEAVEAQALREQAWQIQSQTPQANEADFLQPLEDLAKGAMEQGQWDKAESWLRRGYSLAERHDGLVASRFAFHLGEVFQRTQRLAEAETALRRCLEYRQNTLGADHIQTLYALQALAEVYSAQERYDAAQSMLTRCLEVGKVSLGDDHPDLAGFYRALGVLCQRTQKLDEAESNLRTALSLIEDVEPQHPQLLATLEALGEYYRQLDKLAVAAPFYSRALDSMEQTLGPSHLVVADALLQLGEIHRRQGDSAAAEALFRRCLEIRTQKLPKGHTRLAEIRQALGGLLYDIGSLDAARELYEQALAALWQEPNQGGLQLADCLEGLAAIDLDQDRHSEAESRLQKALSVRESLQDGRQPALLRTHQLTARVYLASRRPDQAERSLKKALDIAQKSYGGDRPEVANCLEQLGSLYLGQGRYVAAEALYDRAFEIRERNQSVQEVEAGFCLMGLGRIQLAQNQLSQAWQNADTARRLYEGLPNQPNFRLTQAQLLLGQILQAQGRLKEAEALFQRSLEARQKLLGNDHPDVQRGLYAFGLLLLEQGRLPQAERVLTHALRQLENRLGNEHPDLADCLHSLGLFYRGQGNGASAELHLKRALDLRVRGLGPEHPDTASSYQAIAQLHLDQHNDEAAEALLKQALAIREKVLRADHPAVSSLLLLQAGLFKSQGRYTDAEPRLKRVMDYREKQLGPNHADTTSVMIELGDLYRLNNQLPQAEALLQRALERVGQRLGEDHPGLLPGLHMLAKVYEAQQRPAELSATQSRIQVLESR